jgi:hypothetical protein
MPTATHQLEQCRIVTEESQHENIQDNQQYTSHPKNSTQCPNLSVRPDFGGAQLDKQRSIGWKKSPAASSTA